MIRFYRGATINLSFTHPQFPKANWSARLILKGIAGANSFDASPDANEEKFLVRISADESADIETGVYRVSYRYENSAEDVQIIAGREIEIAPDPSLDGDQRGQFEKDLEAVDNAIRSKIEGGAVEEYEIQTTVGQRSLKNMSLDDLRKHRRWVLGRLNSERKRAGLKQIGGDRWRRIKSGLGNQSAVPRRRY